MYILKIRDHIERRNKLTKHAFFFNAIVAAMKHKAKHCPDSIMTWSADKKTPMMRADTKRFSYTIMKGDNHMLGYWLKSITMGSIVMAIIIALLFAWSYTPVVYKNYLTGECVRVDSRDSKHTCQNLPERYTHVWVDQ